MQVSQPKRRFSVVAVDLQSITSRTTSGNIKVVDMVDTFNRFVRAVAVPEERAETIAAAIMDHWISLFGRIESLLSDRGPSFIGHIVDELAKKLGVRQLVTYPLPPQANGAMEGGTVL